MQVALRHSKKAVPQRGEHRHDGNPPWKLEGRESEAEALDVRFQLGCLMIEACRLDGHRFDQRTVARAGFFKPRNGVADRADVARLLVRERTQFIGERMAAA